MAISATGAEFVGAVGPDEFPPVIMTEDGGTCTGVMTFVLIARGATAIGARVGAAPPTIITCDEGVRTGGATGVGSLVTGASVEPSPSGGVSWPNRLPTGKRTAAKADNRSSFNFMGMTMR